jgi:hypothetical protein
VSLEVTNKYKEHYKKVNDERGKRVGGVGMCMLGSKTSTNHKTVNP